MLGKLKNTSGINVIILLIISQVIVGCSNYSISKTSLIAQLEASQDGSIVKHFTPFTVTEYPSNNLKRIKCVDEDGCEIWLIPDKNTQFIVTRKSDKKEFRAYFDTLILKENVLHGLRSRIMKMPWSLHLDEVEKIVVYAEFPKTSPVE
jgi:hypothetical protein